MTKEQGEVSQLFRDTLQLHAKQKQEEEMRNKGALAVASSLVAATIEGAAIFIERHTHGLASNEVDKLKARAYVAGVISLLGASGNGNGTVKSRPIVIANQIVQDETTFDNVRAFLNNVRTSDRFVTNGDAKAIDPDTITNAEIFVSSSSVDQDQLKPNRSWLRKDEEPGNHFILNQKDRPKIVSPAAFGEAARSMLVAMGNPSLNKGVFTYEFVNMHAPSIASQISQASIEGAPPIQIDITPHLSPWIQEALAG